MKTVWVVEFGQYEQRCISQIFTSKELAEAYCTRFPEEDETPNEYSLDEGSDVPEENAEINLPTSCESLDGIAASLETLAKFANILTKAIMVTTLKFAPDAFKTDMITQILETPEGQELLARMAKASPIQ